MLKIKIRYIIVLVLILLVAGAIVFIALRPSAEQNTANAFLTKYFTVSDHKAYSVIAGNPADTQSLIKFDNKFADDFTSSGINSFIANRYPTKYEKPAFDNSFTIKADKIVIKREFTDPDKAGFSYTVTLKATYSNETKTISQSGFINVTKGNNKPKIYSFSVSSTDDTIFSE